MRNFITFFSVIVLTNASSLYSLPDGFGSYGINDGSISRQEIRTADGIVRGIYTYIDGDGKPQTVSYGNNNGDGIPNAPASTEGQQQDQSQQSEEMDGEVVELVTESQDVSKEENSEHNVNGSSAGLPQPVPYTPEVAAARAAHFAARDQAIYLQQLTSNHQQLLNQQILEYPAYFRDYYGAAKHYRTVNPYYSYVL